MKKNNQIRMATILGIVALSLLVMSAAGQCSWEFTFPEISNPTGTVVDAYTGLGVAEAELTLTYVSGAPEDEIPSDPFTGFTEDDGTYSISGSVPYGKYNLQASKSGYVFIDETIDISAGSESLPDVIGFPYNETTDEYTVNIIALWGENYSDVQAHITYPGGFGTGDNWNGYATQFDGPYDDVVTTFNGDDNNGAGFFPDEADLAFREHLYASGQTDSVATKADIEDGTDNRSAVEVTLRDANESGPETISVRALPVDYFLKVPTGDFDIVGNATTLLPEDSNKSYAWLGVMNYYVHGKGGNLMTEDQTASNGGADLTIYVFQGDTKLGKYRLPEFTTIEAASVIRMNMFTEFDSSTSEEASFIQLVPDLRILNDVPDSGDIQPAATTENSQVFNLPMTD